MTSEEILKKIKQIDEFRWELPATFKDGMRVPGRIFATEKLLKQMDDRVFDQLSNVACLRGIQKYAMAMPDAHSGYGFPIGGVAGMDPKEGVISPGGIGFDINCGMRLITTPLKVKDVQPKIKELIDHLAETVPAGVGREGIVDLDKDEFKNIMKQGVKWCVENGYAYKDDLNSTESYGCIEGADPEKVSEKAIKRGIDQVGTLGSGNHYLEVQMVNPGAIYDEETARKFGITSTDQIVVMVHCGSRGFGHQVASDYLKVFDKAMEKYKITVRDRELACAPFESSEGQDYYKAMACAANMAFVNRQVILHQVRKAFNKIFEVPMEDLNLVYDVAHNIAKLETHKWEGKKRQLLMHRKGATRAFGPGHEEIPEQYREVGQPVIIGGSMETGSFLLAGTQGAMDETFGSTMHGSGRTMSRTQAKKEIKGEKLQQRMKKEGIYVHATSMSGLAEEAGFAYKDIDEVVNTLDLCGVTKKVVRLKPLGNLKG